MSMLPRRLRCWYVSTKNAVRDTACAASAPDIFFAREEDGHAYVLSETVPEGHEDETQLAADSCPELAIEVEAEAYASGTVAE